jgi:glutathione S-transferase
MHAGFSALRNDMPMDLISRLPAPPLSEGLEANIRRVVAIWMDTRARFGTDGPFLFGAFTCADAMYAPVATRFRTYGANLGHFGDDGTASAYVDAIFDMPEMAEWTAGAEAEMRDRGLI